MHVYIDNTAIEYKAIAVDYKKLKKSQYQTRDSIAQIRQMADNLKPDRLGYSVELSTGAPVIDTDFNIISGHGRVEAIMTSPFYDKYCEYFCIESGYIFVRMIDSCYNSVINKNGITAYDNAVMYSIFGDCVADYINYNDFEYKNVVKTLVEIIKNLDSCNRKPLKQALQLFLRYKQEGYNPEQLDMLDNGQVDNYVMTIFYCFVNNARSSKKMLIELQELLTIESTFDMFESCYKVLIGDKIMYNRISRSELIKKHGVKFVEQGGSGFIRIELIE